jgi:diguanylate cyclase (GGDEF)-like protein
MMGHAGFQRLRRLLWIAAAVIGLVLATLFLGQLWRDRGDKLLETEARLHLLAHALAEHAESTLQSADAALRSAKWAIESRGGLARLDEAALHVLFTRQLAVFAQEKDSSQRRTLFAVGPDGRMLASSIMLNIDKVDNSDREFFLHHRENTGDKSYLGRLSVSRTTGAKTIYLSIRLTDDFGDFAGLVGIGLEINHFDDFYRRLGLSDNNTIVLFRTDGKPLFRYPFLDSFIGVDLADAPNFKRMVASGSGSTGAYASPVDGISKLTGYQTGQRYPLLAIATLTEEAALAPWRRNAIINTSLAALALLALLALLHFAMGKIDEAESALTIARHDPLTGLPNRRYLDEHLQEEWRRMLREQRPLAVLFLDIDHFKNYNDHYGHAAGDACLRTAAACLAGSIRRGGDMVARYGGEEFICVLPNTDAEGAKDMALRFMAAVAAAHVPHAASPTTTELTISVGYASMVPSVETSTQQLLARADTALYAAKADGRNRAIGA